MCKKNCKCNSCCEDCEGCKIKIDSFACVVYDGIPIPSLNISTGDNLEVVFSKLGTIINGINEQIDILNV